MRRTEKECKQLNILVDKVSKEEKDIYVREMLNRDGRPKNQRVALKSGMMNVKEDKVDNGWASKIIGKREGCKCTQRVPGRTKINCGERVMTPGDYARQLTKKVDEEGGIRYRGQTIKEADDLAKELGISPLEQKM
uniref:Uncharacterized protein n=1 Tax=Timema cristinae TaxID=61476 RepID=A0A7R9CFS0_TIMCR|nr:unnamed protein product [Timema cristinae]